jgi:hypothetical protein
MPFNTEFVGYNNWPFPLGVEFNRAYQGFCHDTRVQIMKDIEFQLAAAESSALKYRK